MLIHTEERRYKFSFDQITDEWNFKQICSSARSSAVYTQPKRFADRVLMQSNFDNNLFKLRKIVLVTKFHSIPCEVACIFTHLHYTYIRIHIYIYITLIQRPIDFNFQNSIMNNRQLRMHDNLFFSGRVLIGCRTMFRQLESACICNVSKGIHDFGPNMHEAPPPRSEPKKKRCEVVCKISRHVCIGTNLDWLCERFESHKI